MDLRWTDKMWPHYINWKNTLEKERNEKRQNTTKGGKRGKVLNFSKLNIDTIKIR